YSVCFFFFLLLGGPPRLTLFPYTTLFRSWRPLAYVAFVAVPVVAGLSLAKALLFGRLAVAHLISWRRGLAVLAHDATSKPGRGRSEEHTSELQSRENLVCRLLLEKKKKNI